MRDTWTRLSRIPRALTWWTCAACGCINRKIGDCEQCGA